MQQFSKVCLAAILFFLFSHCHTIKNSTKPFPSPLWGKWSYVSSNGGITGRMPAWPENSKVLLSFDEKWNFKITQDGKTESDSYTT